MPDAALAWDECQLDTATLISSGAAPVRVDDGDIPIMGANGPIGVTSVSNFTDGYLVGRVGAAGAVQTIAQPCWASDNTLTVKPRPGLVDGRFLGHLLRYLDPSRLATQTAQPLVTQTRLGALRFLRPSLPEQRRIAEVLDVVDSNRRSGLDRISKLEQVRDGVLSDMVASLGTIESVALADLVIADVCYGIVQSGDYVTGGVPVLAIRDLQGDFESGLHRTSPAIDTRYRRSRVRPGDVLLSIKGTIGRVGVAPQHYSGNISRELARIRFGQRIRPDFAQLYLSSREAQRRLDAAVVGTTRAEVSIYVLKKFAIPVPRPAVQHKLIDVMGAIDSRLTAEKSMVRKLSSVRLGLADDLISGRIILRAAVAS